MRKFFYILLCFLLYPSFARSQQNLFNIPSGQLTPDGQIFYQHQMNFYKKDSLSSKQHFAIGLNNKVEIGLNFVNLYLPSKLESDQSGPAANILAPTIQQQVFEMNSVSINLGTQIGLTEIGTPRSNQGAAFSYALATYFDRAIHLRITGGAWVSGKNFNGRGDFYGTMAGVEWMYQDGWYLMGDWVSGDTKNSVGVIGGMVDIGKNTQICAGYLLPNPSSSEGHGLVMELNLFTL